MTPTPDTPLVSICVATYNAAAFVQETLDSIAAQTWGRLEIILADDASSDETPEILRAFAASRYDVRLILRDTNLGWTANVNAMLDEATGDFICIAPHDDTIDPPYIETLVNALRADPRAILAYSDVEQVELDGSSRLIAWPPPAPEAGRYTRLHHGVRRAGAWHLPYRGVWRAGAHARVGGLRKHAAGEYAADWPWIVRMLAEGPFVRVPEVMVRKRYRPGSLSKIWKPDPARRRAVEDAIAEAVRDAGLGPLQTAALVAKLRIFHQPRGFSAGLRQGQLRIPGRIHARLVSLLAPRDTRSHRAD